MDVIQMSLAVQMQAEVVAVLLTIRPGTFFFVGVGKWFDGFAPISDPLFALKTFFPGMR